MSIVLVHLFAGLNVIGNGAWSMDFSQLFESVVPLAERLPAVRAILGFILVFFVPGFAWTFVFFSRVNIIERVALSFGLSIASVTLSIIVLHVLFGMRINGANSLLTVIVITIIALAVYLLKRFVIRQSKASNGD
jgi:uncharacterized membrane protein